MAYEKVLVELRGEQFDDLKFVRLETGAMASQGILSKSAAMRHSLAFYARVLRAKGLLPAILRSLEAHDERARQAKAQQELEDRKELPPDGIGDPDEDLPV